MTANTYQLTLPGPMIKRGFWLYVWRVVSPDGRVLHYVGRTGDNSSPNASPAYIRMGQHLSRGENVNALRKHLKKLNIVPEECREFSFIAHGPIFDEIVKPEEFDHSNAEMRASLMKQHLPVRNIVGAMEKRLAEEMMSAGYTVMNEVKWKYDVGDDLWRPVRQAFAEHFEKLSIHE